MKLIEAVNEKLKGNFVRLNYANKQYKIEGNIGNIQIYCLTDSAFVPLNCGFIFSDDWEVVDEDKDWTPTKRLMADRLTSLDSGEVWTSVEVIPTWQFKKCRDLITKELKEYYPNKRHMIHVINKRFGDLK